MSRSREKYITDVHTDERTPEKIDKQNQFF